MINKDAGQLLADRFGQKHCRNGRVYTARQGAKHLAAADFFADLPDRRLHEAVHLPVALTAADLAHEVLQQLEAFDRVHDFRMELRRVETGCRVLHGSHRADRRMGCYVKSLRDGFDIICMTHPHDGAADSSAAGRLRAAHAKTCQLAAAVVDGHFGPAVFTDRRGRDLAAQLVRQKLRAVADTEHRDAQPGNLRVALRRIVSVDAVWTAGQNDAGRFHPL